MQRTNIQLMLRLGVSSLLVAASAPLIAQEPPACASAARTVEAGRLDGKALETLRACPASGPAAIAKAWTVASSASEPELTALVRSSPHDPAVLRAVTATASRRDASRATRLAALQVVMTMRDPAAAVSSEWLAAARVGDPIPRNAHHAPGGLEAQEIRAAEIPTLLATLATDESEPSLMHAALVLRQALEFSDPGHSPIRQGAIKLSAGCRGLVTLTSAENITLRLRVEFGDGTKSDEIWLKPTSSGRPMYPPAGPVIVRYGDIELARLTERAAVTCPSR